MTRVQGCTASRDTSLSAEHLPTTTTPTLPPSPTSQLPSPPGTPHSCPSPAPPTISIATSFPWQPGRGRRGGRSDLQSQDTTQTQRPATPDSTHRPPVTSEGPWGEGNSPRSRECMRNREAGTTSRDPAPRRRNISVQMYGPVMEAASPGEVKRSSCPPGEWYYLDDGVVPD